MAGVGAWVGFAAGLCLLALTLLARQRLIGNAAYLGRLYERWAEWAADVSESHTTYRTLIYFRSRDPRNAWPPTPPKPRRGE